MTTVDDDVLARLEALEALSADVVRLTEEVTKLRSVNLQLEGRLRAQERRIETAGDPAPGPRPGRGLSRSEFLRLGGAAAAAGIVAAGTGCDRHRRASRRQQRHRWPFRSGARTVRRTPGTAPS